MNHTQIRTKDVILANMAANQEEIARRQALDLELRQELTNTHPVGWAMVVSDFSDWRETIMPIGPLDPVAVNGVVRMSAAIEDGRVLLAVERPADDGNGWVREGSPIGFGELSDHSSRECTEGYVVRFFASRAEAEAALPASGWVVVATYEKSLPRPDHMIRDCAVYPVSQEKRVIVVNEEEAIRIFTLVGRGGNTMLVTQERSKRAKNPGDWLNSWYLESGQAGNYTAYQMIDKAVSFKLGFYATEAEAQAAMPAIGSAG